MRESSLPALTLASRDKPHAKQGTLTSPRQIDLSGSENIDLLPPDYELLDPAKYAINDTYYGYTTRGCTNRCPWCGVPTLEPQYVPYIDIEPAIRTLRGEHGDKAMLKLMDNNILASPQLERIVDSVADLGYGRGQITEKTKKRRVVDFNQGLDASQFTETVVHLLAKLNVKPMRVAFDRLAEKREDIRALELAHDEGVVEFSNYMLYNFHDTPRELYDRLIVNIDLNEKWIRNMPGMLLGKYTVIQCATRRSTTGPGAALTENGTWSMGSSRRARTGANSRSGRAVSRGTLR